MNVPFVKIKVIGKKKNFNNFDKYLGEIKKFLRLDGSEYLDK